MVTHLAGDCREVLPSLAAGSVQCVVTSPPYWGLRDYGTASWEGGDPACEHRNGQLVSSKSTLRLDGRTHLGPYEGEKAVTAGMPYRATCGKCGARRIDQQLGLEATPEAYLEAMVGVFRAVRRVLRDAGTLWLNMGDSYASGEVGRHDSLTTTRVGPEPRANLSGKFLGGERQQRRLDSGLKPKDLVGMPWRLAFALQADGWFLRADIIWAKPNPMPESVTDRPTKAHEYVFLLTKSARYFYDADAVREPVLPQYAKPSNGGGQQSAAVPNGVRRFADTTAARNVSHPAGRNLRSVWTLNPEPFPEAHFATFPMALASRCILAGSRMGDTVLDPFGGSGTVGQVAEQLGRHSILIELSPEYGAMARRRTAQCGLFTQERSA